MLGIDIIDLSDPLLKERSKRSLELIQSPEDQTIDHAHLFWLLWTAKEAVFKCRREPLVFDPKSIEIKLEAKGDEILFQSDTIKGKIIQTSEYVLAVCSDDLSSVSSEVYEEENKNWNDRLRQLIKDFFLKKGTELEIGSDDLNIPVLLPSKVPISITHHGKFGAFVFPKTF